jgi:FKBP-type peptidyl-prolyl cis-trans isomerase FkpA
MTIRIVLLVLLAAATASGCAPGGDSDNSGEAAATADTQGSTDAADEIEIMPGLTMRKLRNGYGRAAVPGDYATFHYTGWFYDEDAPDGRGEKFDSSLDRDEPLPFTIGEGRVIRGWDEGVVGMLIGEKRELRIAPDLAYGDRGAGSTIPPGATLLFEVELLGLEGPNDE